MLAASFLLVLVTAIGLAFTARGAFAAGDAAKIAAKAFTLESIPQIVLEQLLVGTAVGPSLWFQFGGQKGDLRWGSFVPQQSQKIWFGTYTMVETGAATEVSFAVVAFKNLGRTAALDLHLDLVVSYAELEKVSAGDFDVLKYGHPTGEVVAEVVVPSVAALGVTYIGILNRWSGAISIAAHDRGTYQNASREREEVTVSTPIAIQIRGAR